MVRFPTAARRIGVIAMVVTATTLGGITAANAAPSGCQVHPNSGGASVYCSGGTGQFRAVTMCRVDIWPDYQREGPWRNPGETSSVSCWKNKMAYGQGVERRH